MIYICAACGLILGIIITIIHNSFVKTRTLKYKIDEASDNINILLDNKLALIIKLQKSINDELDDDKIETISKTKNKNLDKFELDKKLNDSYKEIESVIYDKKIVLEEADKELLEDVKTANIELIGIKNYYNEKCTEFNELIHHFTSLIPRIFKKYKNYELFVIEKELDFEILKKQDE